MLWAELQVAHEGLFAADKASTRIAKSFWPLSPSQIKSLRCSKHGRLLPLPEHSTCTSPNPDVEHILSTTNIRQQNTVSSIPHRTIHRIVNSLRNSSTTRNNTTIPQRNSLAKNSIHLHRRGGNKAPSRRTRRTRSISFRSGVEGLECHQIIRGDPSTRG